MLEVIILAIALAMDAFAVAIGLGAKTQKQNRHYVLSLAIYTGLYFGIAQGIMPLIGYLLGAALLGKLAAAAPWIAGIILISLGSKMLYDVFFKGETDAITTITTIPAINTERNLNDSAVLMTDNVGKPINHHAMFTLAIATSIDAMAAGFTLNLLALNAWLACLIIAIITAGFSAFGIYLGKKSGTYLEDKAEVLGAVVLIAIGLRVMLFS